MGTYSRKDILIDTDSFVDIENTLIGIYLRNGSNLTVDNGTLHIYGGNYAGIKTDSTSKDSIISVNGGEVEISVKEAEDARIESAIDLRSSEQQDISYGEDYAHKDYDGKDEGSRQYVEDEELLDDDGVTKKYVLITPAYPITYDYGDGALPEGQENPERYSRVDEILLKNPVPTNPKKTFLGWVGTGLEEITSTVTIPEKSKGERTYTAVYSRDLSHVELTEPTCLVDGNIEYWIDNESGELFSDAEAKHLITAEDIILKATGHKWGEWTIVKEPEGKEPGLKERVCENDPSHVEQEPIPAPGMAIITYDLNGGTLNGKTGKITETYALGEEIKILQAPEKEGYQFLYWEGSSYQPGDSYTVTEDHTFTAKWEAKSPDTGDHVRIWLWAVLAAASLTVIISSIAMRRKNHS